LTACFFVFGKRKIIFIRDKPEAYT